MADAGKENQSPASSPRGRLPGSPAIGIAIVLICVGIAVLAAMGVIPFPFIGALPDYTITPPATLGEYRSIDFSAQLIPLLGSGGSQGSAGYTFYLGPGAGDPPPGLVLGSDGILKGAPTAEGGNFQVCVRDAGGRTACRTYHLEVKPRGTVTPQPLCTPCPTRIDPPCHTTVEPGVAMSGIPVRACCPVIHDNSPCPVGSSPKGEDNTSPGAPYIICVCD